VLSEDGNLIFPERGRRTSPRLVFNARAKSEDGPSWLGPSWARQVVDTTIDPQVLQDAEIQKGRRQSEFGSQGFLRRRREREAGLEREETFRRRDSEAGDTLTAQG
jgi:hypothetical protein